MKYRFKMVAIALALSGFSEAFGGGLTFNVVADTSSSNLASIDNSISINDAGNLAFLGSDSGGPGLYFSNNTVLHEFATDATFDYGRELQLNNLNQVSAVRIRGGTRTANIWDANSTDSLTRIASSASTPPPGSFSGLGNYTSISNDGFLTFAGLDNGVWEVHTGDALVSNNSIPITTFSTSTVARFRAAEAGRMVLGTRQGSNEQITFYQNTQPSTLASTGGDFDQLGLRPGISDDGLVTAFAGVGNGRNGIFIRQVGPGSTGSINHRLTGITGDGILDPGEVWNDANQNGVVDGNDEDVGGISTIDLNSAISVERSGGPTGNVYRVAFIGTDFAGTKTLYETSFDVASESIYAPTVVARNGMQIPGFFSGQSVQNIAIHDAMNSGGQFAFLASSVGSDAAVVTAKGVRPLRQAAAPWGTDIYAGNALSQFVSALNPGDPIDSFFLPDLQTLENSNQYNIHRKGCLLSSFAMAINELGLDEITPSKLHSELLAQGGITPIEEVRIRRDPVTGDPILDSLSNPIPLNVTQVAGVNLYSFEGGDPRYDAIAGQAGIYNELKIEAYQTRRRHNGQWHEQLTSVETQNIIAAAIDDGKQVLLNVQGGGHWVLATEIDGDTLSVVDPGSAADPARDVGEVSRFFVLSQDPNLVGNGYFEMNSPVDVVITSPSGERVGFDPTTSTYYSEIAGASLVEDFPVFVPDSEYTEGNLDEMSPFLPIVGFFDNLTNGDYTVDLSARATGDFDMLFSWSNASGGISEFTRSGSVIQGDRQSFVVSIDNVPEPGCFLLTVSGFFLWICRKRFVYRSALS